MAEVKNSILMLLKLLAHSVMTALFVIIIAAAGTVTTFALGKICGGTNHVMCYSIWLALEVPFLFGIILVVVSQVLNQADEFFSLLRRVLKSIAHALRGIRKELPTRGGKPVARQSATRVRSAKAISPGADEAVLRLKKNDEAA